MSEPLVSLAGRVEAVKRSRGRNLTLTGVLGATGVVVVGFLAFSLLDILVKLPVWGRTALLALTLAALVVIVLRVIVWPLSHVLASWRVAGEIEHHYPALENALSTSVEFGADIEKTRRESSPAIVDELIRHTAEKVEGLDFRRTVSRRAVYEVMVSLVIVLGLASAYYVALPHMFALTLARFWNPLGPTPPPTWTLINELTPGTTEVARGSGVQVVLETGGWQPEDATIFFRVAVGTTNAGDDGAPREARKWLRETMQPRSGGDGARRFGYAFGRVLETTEYYVEAGDASSPVHRLGVYTEPRIEALRVRLLPPPYTGLEPRTLPEGVGDVTALKGTRVEITARANKPIQGGSLSFKSDAAATVEGELSTEDPRTLTVSFIVSQDDSYQVRVRDERDHTNHDPLTFRVQALEDRRPKVEIRKPDPDVSAHIDQEVKLTIRATDDYGVREIGIYETTGENLEKTLLRKVPAGGRREVEITEIIDLSKKGYRGGEIITYYAYVLDGNTVADKPGEGHSRLHFITTYDEREYQPGQNMKKKKKTPESVKQVVKLIKRQKKILQGTFRTAREQTDAAGKPGADEKLAEDFTRLAAKQKRLRDDTRGVAEEAWKRLREDSEAGVGQPPELKKLEKAAEKMTQALPPLEARQGRPAIKPETEALRKLSETRRLLLVRNADPRVGQALSQSSRQQRQQRRQQQQQQHQAMQEELEQLAKMLEREEELERELERLVREEERPQPPQQAQQNPQDPNRQKAQRDQARKDREKEQQEQEKKKRRLKDRSRRQARELAEQARQRAENLSEQARKNPDLSERAAQQMQQAAENLDRSAQQTEQGRSRQARESARQAGREMRQAERQVAQSFERKNQDDMQRALSTARDLHRQQEQHRRETQAAAREQERARQREQQAQRSGNAKKQQGQQQQGRQQQGQQQQGQQQQGGQQQGQQQQARQALDAARQRMASAGRNQAGLQDELRELGEDLERMANQAESGSRPEARDLRRAARATQAGNSIDREMKAASDAMARSAQAQDPDEQRQAAGSASFSQQEASRRLAELGDTIQRAQEQAGLRRTEDMAKAIAQVKDLQKQQKDLGQKIDQARSNPTRTSQLAGEQQKLRERTERAQRDAIRAIQPGSDALRRRTETSLQKAAAAMDKARENLEKRQPRPARQASRDAEKSLARAARALQQAADSDLVNRLRKALASAEAAQEEQEKVHGALQHARRRLDASRSRSQSQSRSQPRPLTETQTETEKDRMIGDQARAAKHAQAVERRVAAATKHARSAGHALQDLLQQTREKLDQQRLSRRASELKDQLEEVLGKKDSAAAQSDPTADPTAGVPQDKVPNPKDENPNDPKAKADTQPNPERLAEKLRRLARIAPIAANEKQLLSDIKDMRRRLETLLAEAEKDELKRLQSAEQDVRNSAKNLRQLQESFKQLAQAREQQDGGQPATRGASRDRDGHASSPSRSEVEQMKQRLSRRAGGLENDLRFLKERLKGLKLKPTSLRLLDTARERLQAEKRRNLALNQQPSSGDPLNTSAGKLERVANEIVKKIETILKRRVLRGADDAPVPEDYQDIVDQYFEAVSNDH